MYDLVNRASYRAPRAIALVATLALLVVAAVRGAASPSTIQPAERRWEAQVAQQVYTTYWERGEMVRRHSHLYWILNPVARRIAAVADRQYYAPFRFILLRESQPNAFSVPGGNVYVTTGMLSYLSNQDELAGVICHEVNHDIHHDMYDVYLATRNGAQPVGLERAAETHADRSGAYTCAKAGFNPWGMVWNLRLRGGMGEMPATADHPSDSERLGDLVALLTSDKAAFGKFRDDIAAAEPLPNVRPWTQPPR